MTRKYSITCIAFIASCLIACQASPSEQSTTPRTTSIPTSSALGGVRPFVSSTGNTIINRAYGSTLNYTPSSVPEGHKIIAIDMTLRNDQIFTDLDDVEILLDGASEKTAYVFWDIAYLNKDGSFYSWNAPSPTAEADAQLRLLMLFPVPANTTAINITFDGETPSVPGMVPLTIPDQSFPDLPNK
jgi:hypothetical protein